MDFLSNNTILPFLILIPFIAGFFCWIAEKISIRAPRWIALGGMLLTLGLSIYLWVNGHYSASAHQLVQIGATPVWQLEYKAEWIPQLGISIHLALDGLSLMMVALTALLGVLAVGCSWGEIQRHVGFFHLNLLWSLGGVIGVFLAIDMFLFFFFWEMMLVPIYFLIALWGHSGTNGKSRVYAATKFFIYTQASGLIMLIGILTLVILRLQQTHVVSFDYMDLLGTRFPPGFEYGLMLTFFIAFAVKLPVVPLHGWLPDAHAQAPTAGSVDLAGILIKTAAYGLLRFVLPLFPHASAEFAPIAITLGLIGVFYGAWVAFIQTDLKRLIAYTSISHMGFILLALYAGNLLTMQGLMVQMLAHGLSSAALFIMSGQIYERLHTRDMRLMGGIWGRARYLPVFLMFFSACLLGLPGTGNFIGEFLILLGAFAMYPWYVLLATASLVLAGLYALYMIHQTLFGAPQEIIHDDHEHDEDETYITHARGAKHRHAVHGHQDQPVTLHTHTADATATKEAFSLADLNARELSLLITMAVLLIWLGLYPQTVLDTSVQTMQWISNAYHTPLFPALPKLLGMGVH